MPDYQRTTVVGVFENPESAREAVMALRDAGFEGNDVGILMRDREKAREMESSTDSEAGSAAATGLVGGGILGGLAGWLVGVGALAIPGVGPFVAAGAFGAALTGAAIGASLGAVAGALVGMGIPREEAEWYEGEVHGGRTLVTVRADGRFDQARRILHSFGAYDTHDRGTNVSAGPGESAAAKMESTAARSGSLEPEDLDTYNVRELEDEDVHIRDFDETRTYSRPIDEPSTPQMGDDDEGVRGTPGLGRDIDTGSESFTQEDERRRHAA